MSDLISADDAEATEDPSLKIVEKSLQMPGAKLLADDDVIYLPMPHGGGGSGNDEVENSSGVALGNDIAGSEVVDVKYVERNGKTKVEGDEEGITEEEKMEEAVQSQTGDKIDYGDTKTVELNDNSVLRKLLRGPRYFDPPDSGWGACSNCREEDHAEVNCTSAKRKKPCFICGNLDPNAKKCTKGKNCFICGKGGHHSKDCPEKQNGVPPSLRICLKCGSSGHDIFSCKNDYSPDDLKEIQCYVCKKFGHLCCFISTDTTPRELSCYKCGQLGHTGLACSQFHVEATDAVSPLSCYKCGEERHFAQECPSSAKARKGKRKPSMPRTPTSRFQRESEDQKQVGLHLMKLVKHGRRRRRRSKLKKARQHLANRSIEVDG